MMLKLSGTDKSTGWYSKRKVELSLVVPGD